MNPVKVWVWLWVWVCLGSEWLNVFFHYRNVNSLLSSILNMRNLKKYSEPPHICSLACTDLHILGSCRHFMLCYVIILGKLSTGFTSAPTIGMCMLLSLNHWQCFLGGLRWRSPVCGPRVWLSASQPRTACVVERAFAIYPCSLKCIIMFKCEIVNLFCLFKVVVPVCDVSSVHAGI